MMNKKRTINHLLFLNLIKTANYNMMMMHEKSKMRRIPRARSRPWRPLPRSTF
ncbi:hypothetical protein GRZ40_004335 [Salmonella bongori]|nr:hypothetical protein [Salmonella bongori]EDP8727130.1 hypothetical protein [Salmonella bongori]